MNLSKPKIILSIGKPASGKTNSTKWLVLKNSVDRKLFNFGIVFSRTGNINNDYDWMPPHLVIQGYQESVLKAYLSKIEEHIHQHKKPPKNFIIFEDLQAILNKNDPFINNLLAVHRHYGTYILMNFQTIKGGSTTLREIVNYAIVYNTKRRDTIECIYRELGTLIDTYEEFKEIFQSITSEKYTAMLYDSSIEDKNDNYKIYKAPNMQAFKIKLNF